MAENYQVKQGDCISSIAFEKGFFPDTIWNHPNNKALKEKRKDPNVLMPGDVVFVPDKRPKEVSEPTNQVYKFQVKNTPARVVIKLRVNNKPLANQPYELTVDKIVKSGITDAQGQVELIIPPNAKSGILSAGTGENRRQYTLSLGHLDPIDEISGVKARLANLGFHFGKIDGGTASEIKDALGAFQASVKLTPTGELDDATRKKLHDTHIA